MTRCGVEMISFVIWPTLIEGVQQFVNRNVNDNAAVFTIGNAQCLESMARLIRQGLADLEKRAANTDAGRPQ